MHVPTSHPILGFGALTALVEHFATLSASILVVFYWRMRRSETLLAKLSGRQSGMVHYNSLKAAKSEVSNSLASIFRCLRPKVIDGFRRVEWKCVCGMAMYGDYSGSNLEALAVMLHSPRSTAIFHNWARDSTRETIDGFPLLYLIIH